MVVPFGTESRCQYITRARFRLGRGSLATCPQTRFSGRSRWPWVINGREAFAAGSATGPRGWKWKLSRFVACPEAEQADSDHVEFRDGDRPYKENIEHLAGLELLADVVVKVAGKKPFR